MNQELSQFLQILNSFPLEIEDKQKLENAAFRLSLVSRVEAFWVVNRKTGDKFVAYKLRNGKNKCTVYDKDSMLFDVNGQNRLKLQTWAIELNHKFIDCFESMTSKIINMMNVSHKDLLTNIDNTNMVQEFSHGIKNKLIIKMKEDVLKNIEMAFDLGFTKNDILDICDEVIIRQVHL